jgi:hypothetical protein
MRDKHIDEDNIKVVLAEMGYEGMDWIQLVQNNYQ